MRSPLVRTACAALTASLNAGARLRAPGRLAALLLGLLLCATGARGDEPVVTTIADYENDSVVGSITEVENVPLTDCKVSMATIPARGQRSLMVEIGATERGASAACDLQFRLATPFDRADRVATYAWITQGSVELAFRVRDATDQVFETPPLTLNTRNRWVRLAAELSAKQLEPVAPYASSTGSSKPTPTWPIQIQGYRVRAHGIGRQTVHLDDLEVEHRVSAAAMLRGEFEFDRPTHIYEPGAPVRAAIVLENTSRTRALPLNVQMAWLRSDGSELSATSVSVNLPAGTADYRSRQPVDFSQRIVDPGLYRLVARVRGPRWTSPAVFETSIAVSYTNRGLPRGRATFFGVQTNLMREPAADQLIEIEIAREIGVQLLALETPWSAIEPRPGLFELAALDRLVNRITQRDIAVMLVLSDPPDWLAPGDAERWRRQAAIIEALARRYGERVSAYQPLPPTPGRLSDADLAALTRIELAVAAVRPGIEICAPPILVSSSDPSAANLPTLPPDSQLQLAFETTGDPAAALEALDTFARTHRLDWSGRQRWFHRGSDLSDSGAMSDAVAMLHCYTHAAREGVAGLVWHELRDDTNDARLSGHMRGLAQRDFSPKSALLGLANTVGMLHGLLHAGPAPGTPAEYDSAVFVGGQRQVIVLCPRPNRVLPAVLAPYQLVDGELAVFGFDRRLRPLTGSEAPPLAETYREPLFITLDALRAQANPQIGLARPWLRVPGAVHCGSATTFTIEIDAPFTLRRSYLQIVLPPNTPLKSSLSSRALRADAGQTLSFDVELTRSGDEAFEPATLTVRLRVEGATLTVPVTVHPLTDVRAVESAQQVTDARFALGHLSFPDDDEAPPFSPALHAAYQDRKLEVALGLPPGTPADAILQLGIALEGADTHSEVLIESPAQRPKLLPAPGTTREQIGAWRCRLVEDDQRRASFCHVSIPARALGISKFEPGTRLLLAARYLEPQPGGWTAPLTLEWGGGLGQGRSTADYRWVRLRPSGEG